MTKPKPLNLKSHEVLGILSGRKSQIRRMMKPQPLQILGSGKRIYKDEGFKKSWAHLPGMNESLDPYADLPFRPGDRLYGREKARLMYTSDGSGLAGNVADDLKSRKVRLKYEADGALSEWLPFPSRLEYLHTGCCLRGGSYYEAARIHLETVNVRVEKLQDISEEDARAEGVIREFLPSDPDNFQPPNSYGFVSGLHPFPQGRIYPTAKEAYRELYELDHGPGSWAANPFVFVAEFKRVEK